jgi:hypothetical protein
MKDFCTMGCNNCDLSADSKWEIEQIKKEAVKEFAERLKNSMCGANNWQGYEMRINTMLKEYTQCPTCSGKGSAYDDEVGIETCPDCRGKGKIE